MAHMFSNNGLPEDLCKAEPRLWNYGLFRKLKNGKLEFISFCDPRVKQWLAIHNTELNNILDEVYGPAKGRKGD